MSNKIRKVVSLKTDAKTLKTLKRALRATSETAGAWIEVTNNDEPKRTRK